MITFLTERLKPLLLDTTSESVETHLHKIDDLERGIAGDMWSQEIVQQPQDLPAPQPPTNRVHSLGVGLNLVLKGDGLDALAKRRVAFILEHAILALLSQVLVPCTILDLDPDSFISTIHLRSRAQARVQA